MSTTINIENAKQIRKPMEIHSTFTARNESNNLSFVASGGIKAKDDDISSTLEDTKIPMYIISDLSGNGFPLDGSAVLYDTALQSDTDNKVGLRTNVNGTVTVNVSGTSKINALTIAITGGSGTISCNGKTYDAKRIVVIPIDETSTTVTFKANNNTRLDIASITDGITLEFNSENIISCSVALRSNLDIIDPSWEVSDFELTAYCTDDLETVIGNIGDDVPITYYSGYEGDYSPVRTFYLSEKANISNNVLTLKADDISSKLDGYTLKSNVALWKEKDALKSLYNKLYSVVNSALGGKFPLTVENAPDGLTGTNGSCGLYFKEQDAKTFVSNLMNICHCSVNGVDFYPVFVDAGIPTIRWSKPVAKWDIYEEDCGDVSIEYDRNINRLVTDGENDIETTVSVESKATTIEKITVTKNEIYDRSFDTYMYNPTITNGSVISVNAESITFKALKTTKSSKKTVRKNGRKVTQTVYTNQSILTGRKATVNNSKEYITSNRAGITQTITPHVLGKLTGNGTFLYPNYNNLFNVSNVTGSFTFKGDPRMQPRDVFRFHRLDGTIDECTIETITLNHENGGLSADLTYRKGVV